MSTVYLHVGFHKTATSSFQLTCFKNKVKLKNRGFYYPTFTVANRKPINHGIALTSLFEPNPEKFFVNVHWGIDKNIDEINKDYDRQFDEILNHRCNIILSGEAISTFSDESLQKLKARIEEFGHKIKVICAVRTPYSFLCSDLQERIKIGVRGADLCTTINVPKKSQDILRLKKHFNDIEFIPFSEMCKHDSGPVGYLYDIIGIDISDIDILGSNVGIGNTATRVLAALNEKFWVFDDLGNRNSLSRDVKIETINPADMEVSFCEKKFLLTENELKRCDSELDAENKIISDLLGDEFCDSEFGVSEELNLREEEIKNILFYYRNKKYYYDVLKFLCLNTELNYFSIIKISRAINNSVSLMSYLKLYILRVSK